MSDCQIWLLCSASKLLVHRRASSLTLGEAALLRKRQSVEGEVPALSWPDDRANSRNSVVPVRCGFSRLRRSIRSASRCNRSGLATVQPSLGRKRFKGAVAITNRPVQQGIHRDRRAEPGSHTAGPRSPRHDVSSPRITSLYSTGFSKLGPRLSPASHLSSRKISFRAGDASALSSIPCAIC